jgi:hypothetical protein
VERKKAVKRASKEKIELDLFNKGMFLNDLPLNKFPKYKQGGKESGN